MLANTRYFYLPVSILAENANKMQILDQKFVYKFDTQQNSKLAKIFILKFILKSLYQYLIGSNK